MKLYDCSTAPSPRRVRMFIAEKRLARNLGDLEMLQVDLGSGEQHSEAFIKINPHRTVPALVLDSGEVLSTSTAIVHYLESRFPEPALIGTSAEERAIIMDLDWRIESEGFMAVGEALRNRAKSFTNNALTGKHEHAQIPELVKRGALRTEQFFEWLNNQLAGRTYVAGEKFSLADITAFVTVEFAKWIKQQPTTAHSNVLRWQQDVSGRASAAA